MNAKTGRWLMQYRAFLLLDCVVPVVVSTVEVFDVFRKLFRKQTNNKDPLGKKIIYHLNEEMRGNAVSLNVSNFHRLF